MKLQKLCSLLLLSAIFAAGSPIVIGLPADPGTGNCFPFGCVGGGASTRYQQVYDKNQFPGPMTIGKLIFYADAFTGDSNLLASGSWTIYLSTTPYAVNDIDSRPFNDNVGADNMLFAVVNGGVTIPDVWVITGNPFNYNPANGNLLLDIHANISTNGFLFLNARNGTAGGVFSRYHNFGTTFDDWGLVTGFDVADDVVIPEPGAFLLTASGLGSLLAMRRRRRTV
ncbi:MAG: PEP-CTERM sorting domain-containing protein [Verrucomicrobiota bacterium]|nr:PEP-CTERM sorting domain-containing protein [Limisphaera sp.]MDW8383113.1 PEP-CTERM sorting domain-containing protein [Verrucomicrobiota bacterium]